MTDSVEQKARDWQANAPPHETHPLGGYEAGYKAGFYKANEWVSVSSGELPKLAEGMYYLSVDVALWDGEDVYSGYCVKGNVNIWYESYSGKGLQGITRWQYINPPIEE